MVNTALTDEIITSPPKTPRSKRKQTGAKKASTPASFRNEVEDMISETSTSPSSHIPSLEDCSQSYFEPISNSVDQSFYEPFTNSVDDTGSGCSTLVQSMENIQSAMPSQRPENSALSRSQSQEVVPSPSPRIKKRARKEQLLQQHKLFGKDVLDTISKENSN